MVANFNYGTLALADRETFMNKNNFEENPSITKPNKNMYGDSISAASSPDGLPSLL